MPEAAALERLRHEAWWMAARVVALVEASDPQHLPASLRTALKDVAQGVPAPPTSTAHARAVADPDAPLARLIRKLGLLPVDVDLVVLAGLSEQHEALGWLMARLHPAGAPRATVGLAARLLCRDPEERRLFTDRLLRGPATQAGLLRIRGEAPLFERPLQLPPAMWWALGGVDAGPDALAPRPVAAVEAGLDAWVATPEVAHALQVLREDAATTVVVSADSARIAVARAAVLAARAGRAPLVLRTEGPLTAEREQALGLTALARGATPVLEIAHAELGAVPTLEPLAGHPGAAVVAMARGRARLDGARRVLEVDAPRLDDRHRRRAWTALLPELAGSAPRLAARYSLEPSEIRAVAEDARGLAQGRRGGPSLEDVARAVRSRAGVTLSAGIQLRRPRATWDDLVLPRNQQAQLEEAVGRLEQQVTVLDEWGFLAGRSGARGVRLLFAGPPGTGKTLSAEVLASALGVDLLVVDISRVVSKWIGETEKNLARVFDIAEESQALLLFDEADALFGKRTEVSDAHDRYANLETAFLLSRLERFEGMAVLSTNLRQNIDPAFLRRLEFILDYDEPDLAERRRIWRCHVPRSAPLADDVDFDELSELYPVVGGVIRNAAVAAAFLAASESPPIRQQHFLRALRREYDKAGRAFPGMPRGARAVATGDEHAHYAP